MQTTIPLFFFLLYFAEHSLTTHKGPCLADRSCNYLLVLTRVQRSEISISNNNGVRDAGSCMLGIWKVSRLLEPTWGEENPHRGLCPQEGGHRHFGLAKGKFQQIPYTCWGKMINLSSSFPAVNPSAPTHSVCLWTSGKQEIIPAAATLLTSNVTHFFHLQSARNTGKNRLPNHEH